MTIQFEKIFVVKKRQEHEGIVLGAEGELFWLLVHDLDEVHRGHTNNVFSHLGKKYLRASEWHHSVASMFDVSGQFISDAFYHSAEPEEMIRFIKTHRLLRPGAA